MRCGLLFLTLCLACGDAGSRHSQVSAVDSALGFSGRFSPDQFQDYERGRRLEIAALRSGKRFLDRAIDSIGAGAAGLAVEDYRKLTSTIDSYLKQRLQLAATKLAVVPASDSLLALLDSLRVERLVLEVQVGR